MHMMSFFFFKQKTAYELGLGIPAEPLFRSKSAADKGKDNHEYPFLYQRQTCHQVQPNQATYQRSEERRVGKECRCRWPPRHRKKQTRLQPRKQDQDVLVTLLEHGIAPAQAV